MTTKPFMNEAPNGYQSFYDMDDLMQEARVYQNPSAKLTSILFTKGVLSAQDVLDALSLNDTFQVTEEEPSYSWAKVGARTNNEGTIEFYREEVSPSRS